MNDSALKTRLAAILSADVAGYSRLMAADEHGTIAALDAARGVFREEIASRQGRVVDMAGDSILAVFDLATGAVSAGAAIQKKLTTNGNHEAKDRTLRFRIGVHLGEIIEKSDGTVYGDGINVAARLQALAEPGGVFLSDAVHAAVRYRMAMSFEDKGEHAVKNIPHPIRAFRIASTELQDDPMAIARAVVSMSSPVPGFEGRPAVAVLPFTNMSGDPEQDYFGDGLAEDLLTRLAMWRWLPVIARNSSFTFKGRAVDVKAVGEALGARYVLEGSVRKGGNRVRVTAQLIDSRTGHHVWAERYDRVLDDLFALQDELTDDISGALESAIGRAEIERVKHAAPSSLDVWDAYQRGWAHLCAYTREDFAAAVTHFNRAMAMDPGLSLPVSGLAFVRMFEGFFLWTTNPAETFREAAAYAQKALLVDSADPRAYAILGIVLAFNRKLDEALACCRKSVELDPSNVIGHAAIAATCLWRGEAREGIRAGERVVRLSPNDVNLHVALATLSANHYMERNYPRAVDIARLAIMRAPHYPIAWCRLTNALAQDGRIPEACDALETFLELMPNFTTESAARASVGFVDEQIFQHYLEGLRKAGWQG